MCFTAIRIPAVLSKSGRFFGAGLGSSGSEAGLGGGVAVSFSELLLGGCSCDD